MPSIIELCSPMLVFWCSYLVLIPFFNSRIIKPFTSTYSNPPDKYYYVGVNVLSGFLYNIIFFKYLWAPEMVYNINYRTIFKYIISGILVEIYFYLSHRLMHHRLLYKYHSIHHRVIYPRAYACVYCHWIEMIVVNISTVMFGVVVTKMNMGEICLWMFIACFNTMWGHSGGDFNLSILSHKYHYRHHTLIGGNYGTGMFMDKTFNTEFRFD